MNEAQSFLDGRVVLHGGDCRDVLKGMAENSVDSVVTDPPYHLQSIVKRFAKTGRTDKTWSRSGPHQRTAGGFMNKQWDGGDIAFQPELWAEVLRVLKPGGYILAFSGCRTYHHMACAIEDAGFITHPMFAWVFGSGFPKAHSVSKQIDKAAGAERALVRTPMGSTGNKYCKGLGDDRPWMREAVERGFHEHSSNEPITDTAREWDGWFYGTQSLKPALEPVYFGQKPFEKGLNGAKNVQKWGVGAIFVDGARVRHHTMDTILGRARRTFSCAAREFGNSIFCKDPSPDADNFFRTLDKQLSLALDRLTSVLHEDDRAQISSSPPNCQDRCSIYSHLCDALFHISKDDVLSSVQQQLCAHKHNRLSTLSGSLDHELIDSALYECMNRLANLGSLLQSDPQASGQFSAEALSHDVEEYLKLFLDCIGIDLPDRLSPDRLHKVSQWLVLSPLKTILAGGNWDADLACETVLINILLGPHLITNSLHLLIRIVEKQGRWPANLLLEDGSEEVLACFPDSKSCSTPCSTNSDGDRNVFGVGLGKQGPIYPGDSGSAARFFYTSKADAHDRCGSKHPTVKPLDLLQYFVRLVTPPGGVVLDHFAGSGTTGEACFREGFRAILIEREAEYVADIERRMALVMEGPVTRAHAGMKARARPVDNGPLFGGSDDYGVDRNSYGNLEYDRGLRKHEAAE